MTTEDQDLLAKISQVAGKINRHKTQQQPASLPPFTGAQVGMQTPYNSYHSQANTTWRAPRGVYTGRGRGYSRGSRTPQVHRNKTLVLNGGVPASASSEYHNGDAQNAISTQASSNSSPSAAWVTKTDRHLQLINPAIYEKQSQQRAKAMEETRRLKLKQRDERERLKLSKHFQRIGDFSATALVKSAALASNYEISVQGIRFRVVKNGSKLLKASGDENAAKATPKTTTVGGVIFYRSKNGNLYRSGIVKAQRYDATVSGLRSGERLVSPNTTNAVCVRRRGVVKKIDEPCRAFSTTGTCLKGPKCRYIHDPSKVAICKDFLQKGTCLAGESCDLSHELSPERTPACLHFARGNCSNPDCRYTHVRVSPNAPVCRPFGIYGYCEKGSNCTDRHVHECPDFSNTGICSTKGCKLVHRYKASVIRKNAARDEQHGEEESSDLSSDEEQDEIDSDDVDSDDIDEEYFGAEESEKDSNIPMQQDFVHLI